MVDYQRCPHGYIIDGNCWACRETARRAIDPAPGDNPMVDIIAALARIEEKLDRLAPSVDAGREYLTVAEAAEIFNLSVRALYRMKSMQIRRGRSIRFRRSMLERHLRCDRLAA